MVNFGLAQVVNFRLSLPVKSETKLQMFILALILFSNSFAFQEGLEKSDPNESVEEVFDGSDSGSPVGINKFYA